MWMTIIEYHGKLNFGFVCAHEQICIKEWTFRYVSHLFEPSRADLRGSIDPKTQT